jgi:hypothetical protein
MSVKIILLLIFVGLVGYAFGRLSGGRGGGVEPMLQTSVPRVLDTPTLDEIKRLVREQQLIAAIRIYRERTNCGLREAKEAVESIARNL